MDFSILNRKIIRFLEDLESVDNWLQLSTQKDRIEKQQEITDKIKYLKAQRQNISSKNSKIGLKAKSEYRELTDKEAEIVQSNRKQYSKFDIEIKQLEKDLKKIQKYREPEQLKLGLE